MGVSFEEHAGNRILVADYRGIVSPEEMVEVLHEYTDILRESSERIDCLELYEGSFGTAEFVSEGNRLGKEVHVHKIGLNALVGVTGIKKVLLRTYLKFSGQKNVRTFDTKDEAVQWLCRQQAAASA